MMARIAAFPPKASQFEPTVFSTNLEMPCVCTCLSDPPILYQSAAPRVSQLILQWNLHLPSWNSLWEWWPDLGSAGAQTWTKPWTLPLVPQTISLPWYQTVQKVTIVCPSQTMCRWGGYCSLNSWQGASDGMLADWLSCGAGWGLNSPEVGQNGLGQCGRLR